MKEIILNILKFKKQIEISYTCSPLTAACAVANILCRYEEMDQTSSAMTITTKDSSIQETIPRGPFTSAGLFHDAQNDHCTLPIKEQIK